VVRATQARGARDPFGRVEAGSRPIAIALSLALVVHMIPPALEVKGLISWMQLARGAGADHELTVPEQEVIIPVELDMLAEVPAAPATVPADPAPAVARTTAPAAPADELAEEEDDDEPVQDSEVKVPVAPKTAAKSKEPAPEPAPSPAPAPPAKPATPVEPANPKLKLASVIDVVEDASVRSERPNVEVYLSGRVLRQRQLGAVFGDLLTVIPQWQQFLGGTGIDPIAHFDHVHISTPKLSKDAEWVVARVGFNLGVDKIREAIGGTAARTKGKELKDYDLPVWSIDEDKRRVVLIEAKNQLVVLPADADEAIDGMAGVQPFPANPPAGILIHLIDPAVVLKGRFPLPKSLKQLTLHFSLDQREGYVIKIEMIDESPESAKAHAPAIEAKLEDLRPIPLVALFSKKYFFGKPAFEVDGEIIRASAKVSEKQVEHIMKLVKLWLSSQEELDKEKAKKKKAEAKKARARARSAADKKKRIKKPGLFDGLKDKLNQPEPAP
jgi:hypothetical protein